MAGEIVGRVLKLPAATVSRSEKLLLVALANYSNRQGERAFPSVQTLMAASGLRRRQTQRLLRHLEQRGFIEEEAPPGRYRPRTFRLCWKAWASSDDAHAPPEPHSWASSDGAHDPARAAVMGVISNAMGVISDVHGRHSYGARSVHDPSLDPRAKEPRQKTAAIPQPADTPKTPKTPDTFFVLQRLAHDVLDANPSHGYPDQMEALKQKAAELQIPYDSHVISSAFGSAWLRRQHAKARR